MTRVLVVEDEAVLADAVAAGLRRAGFAVDVAYDGADGDLKLAVTRYDVVVLDRDLPGVHGDEVCRRVVAAGRGTRVLMLTAAVTVPERVRGLSSGADDYLTKPFAFEELVARVRALGRRSAPAHAPVLHSGGVRLDTNARRATRGGADLPLTGKELTVLEVLMTAGGRVVSAEELLDRCWDEHLDPLSNVVRVLLSGLRRKLGNPPLITTVTGAGYRWDAT